MVQLTQPNNIDRFRLFRHISTGEYQWYPAEYATHPVWGPDLRMLPTGSNAITNNPSFETPGPSVELARNLATNPSFEAASAVIIDTPEGLRPVPASVDDYLAPVWQSSLRSRSGSFSAAFQFPPVVVGPYPDNFYPDTSYPG